MTIDQQERLMKKIKGGYREKVLDKLKHHPNDTLVKDEDIVDKLTERERFRSSFCTNIIEGISETLVIETLTDSKKADISHTEAKKRAEKRIKVFCNFPVKLLLYSKSRRKSLKLKAALQVGNYYFEWNKTSLIIPKMVNKLTSKQPVLKVGVSQEGAWCSYVTDLKPHIDQALAELDYDSLIQLKYQLAERKDELLSALIDVVVRYNRLYSYNKGKCSNLHFLRDAQLALGIVEPAKISGNLSDHFKKTQQEWKKRNQQKQIGSHGELDQYVEDTRKMEDLNQEILDCFITRYFKFHVSGWEKDTECETWDCKGQNCKLPTIEDLVDLYMW